MKAYPLVELAIALLCALLAALHLLFHFADRRDRTRLWMAVALLGGGILNASLAGSSGAAAGDLGWSLEMEWEQQKPFGRDEIQRTLSTMRMA